MPEKGGGARVAARPRASERKTAPAVASLAVHLVAVALAWWTGVSRPEPVEFVSYHIEMTSLPAPEPAGVPEPAPPEDLVVEDPRPAQPEPDPIPPPPEPEPDPAPAPERQPEPERRPEPPRPDPPRSRPDPPPEETPERARSPDPDPSAVGGEAIDVRLEGLRRDYPAYYENIIRQINRCMRWRGSGTPETTVYFVIRKDGTMEDLRPLEPSGNFAFDAEALGAVECAGARFGPLPEGLPYDRLPVRFTISAGRGGGAATAVLSSASALPGAATSSAADGLPGAATSSAP
ncbi:MAG: TonB C-terminal domain-containing protein [Gemmatimonadetes bacterium]|nr:TonB C-terminal domain-containing protein [Gemmatimonadota bacterium]